MPGPRLPVPPPSVPRRGGSVVLRGLGRAVFTLLGWRVEGNFPDVAHCVAIAAPHTSNWDFVVGLAALLALDLRITWLGKHTIFKGPLRAVWRRLGGVPVDRAAPEGTVAAAAELFTAPEAVWIALAPEGTRYKVDRWKTGFWRIARAGMVPILPVAIDHGSRLLRIGSLYTPTDDQDADLAALQRNFSAKMARRPDRY